MGDMSDQLTEQGMDELALHERGECDTEEPCRYCAEEQEGQVIEIGPGSSPEKIKKAAADFADHLDSVAEKHHGAFWFEDF